MKKRLLYGTLALLLMAIASCVFLDSVDQPASVKAGETFTITMNCHVSVADGGRSNERLIIAFLAPKSWVAAMNSTVTYTTDNDGNGSMVPIPASVIAANNKNWPAALKERFGMGGNYMVDDLEWVAFWSTTAYNMPNGANDNIVVTINTKAGPENTQFKTGYFLGCSTEGLSDVFGANNVYKNLFKDCFNVTDGEGDLIDFCNPQIAAFTPGNTTDNDWLTISFDPTVVQTALEGTGNVYLCGTAYTEDGDTLTTCESTANTLLMPYTGKKSAITIWPRAFFKVPEGKTLKKFDFFFTDASGTVKVGFANSSTTPFPFTFKCQ